MTEHADRIARFLEARDTWNATLKRHTPYIQKFPHPTINSNTFAELLPEDLRALLADVTRLSSEVEQLQVEIGHALAPDDEDEYEPLTLRDVDPGYVAQCEEDDRIADMVYEPGPEYSTEAPF